MFAEYINTGRPYYKISNQFSYTVTLQIFFLNIIQRPLAHFTWTRVIHHVLYFLYLSLFDVPPQNGPWVSKYDNIIAKKYGLRQVSPNHSSLDCATVTWHVWMNTTTRSRELNLDVTLDVSRTAHIIMSYWKSVQTRIYFTSAVLWKPQCYHAVVRQRCLFHIFAPTSTRRIEKFFLS